MSKVGFLKLNDNLLYDFEWKILGYYCYWISKKDAEM